MPVLFPSEPPAVLLSPYWLLCHKKWQQRYENACEWAARGFCSVLSVLAVTVCGGGWELGGWELTTLLFSCWATISMVVKDVNAYSSMSSKNTFGRF